MVAKLFPFHGLVPINIHLLKEIDQGQCEILLKFLVLSVILEMFKHNGKELLEGKTFLLFLETLFNKDHFLAVQHLQDLVL